MFNISLVVLGKFIALVSRILNLGNGSTWPGHVALNVNKNFIKDIIKLNQHLKIILIVGTNGKTTTGKLIQTILEKAKYRVFQNESGANLLNGIASTLIRHSNIVTKINYDLAIFEVDENTLPLILKEIIPDYLILLNLFRDQLDRYGEINTIANKWEDAIGHLLPKTKLILNADDPQIAYLGKSRGVLSSTSSRWNHIDTPVFYFGLDDKTLNQISHEHAVDSTYCPNCSSKLHYHSIYYSHLGDWQCKNCDYKRPKIIFSNPPPSSLKGIYNKYNILAAVLVSKNIGISDEKINSSIKTFTPAFGRQEILSTNGKKVQIFLSKNPTGFNESLRTISDLNAKNLLIVLNDRIPDGRDVSWIWDVDFEDYVDQFESIIISGDRCYDMGIRIKYAQTQNSIRQLTDKSQNYNSKLKTYESLKDGIEEALLEISNSETLYVLPTYSAMLEVRKILTGKKIL